MTSKPALRILSAVVEPMTCAASCNSSAAENASRIWRAASSGEGACKREIPGGLSVASLSFNRRFSTLLPRCDACPRHEFPPPVSLHHLLPFSIRCKHYTAYPLQILWLLPPRLGVIAVGRPVTRPHRVADGSHPPPAPTERSDAQSPAGRFMPADLSSRITTSRAFAGDKWKGAISRSGASDCRDMFAVLSQTRYPSVRLTLVVSGRPHWRASRQPADVHCGPSAPLGWQDRTLYDESVYFNALNNRGSSLIHNLAQGS